MIGSWMRICGPRATAFGPWSGKSRLFFRAFRNASKSADYGDPFDRILAAESMVHGLTILSPDTLFRRLGCEVIW